MIIEKLSSLTVKVSLSHNELTEFGLNFEKLDSNNTETKQLIKIIIEEIKRNLGLNLHNENLYIETFSSRNGCILYISVTCTDLGFKISNTSKRTDYLILETPDEKNLIRFSCDLFRYLEEYVVSSSLYYYNGTFRMILKINIIKKDSITDCAENHILNVMGGIEAKTATEEYFKCIFESEAAERLSGKKSF